MLRPVLALLLAAFVAAPVSRAQTASAPAVRLDSLVDAAHKAGEFDGVVLVGRRGATVYARAVGTAAGAAVIAPHLCARPTVCRSPACARAHTHTQPNTRTQRHTAPRTLLLWRARAARATAP